MKKSRISQIAMVIFTICFLISVRYFDKEAAGMFITFAVVGFALSIWYLKNNL